MCDNHEIQTTDPEMKDVLTKRRMIQGIAAGTMVGYTAAASGCATNPETGDRQFILIGESQLNSMAAQSWADAKQKQKVSTDPRYTQRLARIGSRISQGAGRGDQSWDYAVFDDDTKNAFVLPGNRVGFYKGMMDFAETDSQIAAIMGHEVGHVSGRHAAERVSQQMAGNLAVQAGSAYGSSKLMDKCRELDRQMRASGQYNRAEIVRCVQTAQRNSQLLTAGLGMGLMYGLILPYSRKHELQADILGAKYMHKAGYDVRESVTLWEKMAAENTNRQPEWMSTHPDPARRAQQLSDYITAQGW